MFAIAFDMDINCLTLPLSLKINKCICKLYMLLSNQGVYMPR